MEIPSILFPCMNGENDLEYYRIIVAPGGVEI